MSAQRQKFGIGTLIFILLIGAAFTWAGMVMVGQSKIDPSWQRVAGMIVDSTSRISKGSTTYTPIVQYQVGDQTYRITAFVGTSMYPAVGTTREVAYDPAQPHNAKVVESGVGGALPYIFSIIGVALCVFAIVSYIRSLKRGSEIKRLMQSGQKLQGVLVDVEVASTSSNRRSSYKLVVAATDSAGIVQNYVSDSISGIAAIAMQDFRTTPIPLDVYVDPADPESYYVDISDVPNLTPDKILELLKKASTYTSVNGRGPATL
ncbi:MAG: DUF3592 domain-containing protein [Patescibacteria group bacterium]